MIEKLSASLSASESRAAVDQVLKTLQGITDADSRAKVLLSLAREPSSLDDPPF